MANPKHSVHETVTVPLSKLDAGVGMAGSMFGWTVEGPVDTDLIIQALDRLTDKWRLLSGRVAYTDATKSQFQLVVPISSPLSPDYARYHFSTSNDHDSISLDLHNLGKEDLVIQDVPNSKYFCHASSSYQLGDLVKSQKPLLSIHVSTMRNCKCIGILFPHGVFDGVGMGMIIHALDAEMHGREWVVPPLVTSSNPIQDKLDELMSTAPSTADLAAAPALPTLIKAFRKNGIWPMAILAGCFLYEIVWHKLETKSLFFGEDIVKAIVAQVKEEVRASGKGWVGKADVLFAWFVKVINLVIRSLHSSLTLWYTGALSRRIRNQSKYPRCTVYGLRQKCDGRKRHLSAQCRLPATLPSHSDWETSGNASQRARTGTQAGSVREPKRLFRASTSEVARGRNGRGCYVCSAEWCGQLELLQPDTCRG